MKIKGEVEVFKIMKNGSSESVLKESNMVVDGAAEVIVDMLTTPYSLKNVAGSASLNPSNFTIQAVSLGKAERLYGGHPDTSAADTDVIGMHSVWNNMNLSTSYFVTAVGNVGESWFGARLVTESSSFVPSRALPKEPFPRDISLEDSSKTQIELYYEIGEPEGGWRETSGPASGYTLPFAVEGGGTGDLPNGWNNASALVAPHGHNLNSIYGRTAKSMETMFQGCYAPSDGFDVYIWKKNLTRYNMEDEQYPLGTMLGNIYSTVQNVSGRYNTVGSMDRDGYLVAYPIQDHPASGDPTQGVVVSAATTSSLANVQYTDEGLISGSGSFIGSPAVCYNFSISSSDLLALAAYKGVTNIGLWAFDLKETLKQEEAPVAWDAPTNNRKYKLFSKKVFSEDLTTIDDSGLHGGIDNYADLNIQWRINFNFGRTF